MTGGQDVIERLERIEEKENRRLVYGKIQLALTAAVAVMVAAALCVMLPRAQELYTQGKQAVSQARELMNETEEILQDVDLSQLEKLERLDVDGLNQAIEGINQVIEAMERLFSLVR